MFKNTKAFSSFSVDDSEKARQFYGDTLGMNIRLEEGMEEFGVLQLSIAGSEQDILIYPKNDHQPATFTILNFPVDDIEEAIDKLRNKGVTFEFLDNPDMPQDEKGIFRIEKPKIAQAWFKDPAGNVLSVLQEA